MNVVDILCVSRFQCFQHVPDHVKRPIYQTLLRLAARRYVFAPLTNLFDNAFKTNRWMFLSDIVRQIKRAYPASKSVRKEEDGWLDTELVLALFEEESDPALARSILHVLLRFFPYTQHLDAESRRKAWNIGTHLLLNAGNPDDKQAALAFLSVHLAAPTSPPAPVPNNI